MENRQSWLQRDPNEERHKGSYDLEALKLTDEYARRIEQVGATKRKYAVCFGYLGSNYQGLQINPGAATVEREMEKAFLLCGGIQECNFGYLQKVQYTRAARTDRGVHAVTQCCALKLLAPLDKRERFIEQLNSFLPPDIRAFTMTKVSKGFNAKSHCTKRRYHYLLPTYALQPHADLTALLQAQFDLQGPVAGAGSEGGYLEEFSKRGVAKAGLETVYNAVKGYRASADTITRLREALKAYVGTRSYHNFTTGKLPSDTNAKRFIISFDCGESFVDAASGVEWVQLTVLGQSFLLNQIRKMVGMAMEVCRGATPPSTILDAFTTRKMDLPMAPSLGLYLGELFFDGYNAKQRKEIANDKRLAAIRAGKKTTTAAAPAASAEPSSSEVQDGTEGAGTGKGEGEGDGEAPSKRMRPNPPGEGEQQEQSAFALTAAVAAAADAGNVEGNEKEDESQTHEEIDWSSDPATLRATDAFRDGVIHPHVFQQDGKTLDFMYYFDFLRAIPRDYSSMTTTFASASTSASSGRPGGPPAIKVKGEAPAQGTAATNEDDFEE